MDIEPAQPHCTETPEDTPAFAYLSDPICLGSALLYVLNRWLFKPYGVGGEWIHNYFNDLLCLPLFLPVILRLQALFNIRRHDRPPTLTEIFHNWAVFSVLFELVLPRMSLFESIADPWDSAAYLLGGLLAYAYWHSGRPIATADC